MIDYPSLLAKAQEVRKNAYAPYSRHSVGAALLGASGRVYTGCNLENAAYSVICAERSAIAQAVSRGEREYLAVAVCGGPEGQPGNAGCYPCGVCRQMLFEFSGNDLPVAVGTPEHYQVVTLGELLPHAFGPRALKGEG